MRALRAVEEGQGARPGEGDRTRGERRAPRARPVGAGGGVQDERGGEAREQQHRHREDEQAA